jgi:hypothetical protein
MMKRVRPMRVWLLLFLLPPFAARADEPHQEAYLRCDPGHNQFVVRFGLRYNDDPAETAALAATALPVDRQLERQPLAHEGACTLADRTKVTLTFLSGQASAYGQGGGDPDVTFTLAFDDVPLYFQKTFYTGYASAFPARYDVSALAYDGHTLLACPGTAADFAPGPIAPPAPCEDDSGRLQLLSKPFAQGFALFSDEEKTRLIDDLRRRQLTARLSPLCQELDTVEKSFVAFSREDGSPVESAEIDIDNDGEPDHVVRVAGDTGYFDGSFLVVYPAGKPREPDETTLAAMDPETVREEFASHRWPAILISLNNNVPPRYSRNEVFAHEGKNYILSATTNRSMIPARLVSVLPAEWSFAKTLCEYP